MGPENTGNSGGEKLARGEELQAGDEIRFVTKVADEGTILEAESHRVTAVDPRVIDEFGVAHTRIHFEDLPQPNRVNE